MNKKSLWMGIAVGATAVILIQLGLGLRNKVRFRPLTVKAAQAGKSNNSSSAKDTQPEWIESTLTVFSQKLYFEVRAWAQRFCVEENR